MTFPHKVIELGDAERLGRVIGSIPFEVACTCRFVYYPPYPLAWNIANTLILKGNGNPLTTTSLLIREITEKKKKHGMNQP